MAEGMPPGDLVGTGRIEEVAGEGAQFRAVEIRLVVERHRFPACRRVHAPADMADGIGLAVAPGGDVGAEQVGIEIVAGDLGDIVVRDRQRHRRFHIAFEGQVHVAAVEHQRAGHAAGRREAQAQAARPVGHGAGPLGEAPAAARRRAVQPDGEVGAAVGGHAHFRSRAQHPDPGLDPAFELRLGRQPLQGFGMLVGDHQAARALLQDLRQFGRVQHALDGAIDEQGRCAQRLDHRRQPLHRVARAGRAHRHGRRLRRRRQHEMERLRPHRAQGQFGQLHIDGARLGLRQDGDRIAGLDRAQAEHRFERPDPLGLDPLLHHGMLSAALPSGHSNTTTGERSQ